VDVLARRQSAFNRDVLTALRELAECCRLLDATRRSDQTASAGGADNLRRELAETRQRCEDLERRLAMLEAATARTDTRIVKGGTL
jgi:hypothetical protein